MSNLDRPRGRNTSGGFINLTPRGQAFKDSFQAELTGIKKLVKSNQTRQPKDKGNGSEGFKFGTHSSTQMYNLIDALRPGDNTPCNHCRVDDGQVAPFHIARDHPGGGRAHLKKGVMGGD